MTVLVCVNQRHRASLARLDLSGPASHMPGMRHTSFHEHRELGEIVWHRDYDIALTLAAKTKRPVLLLFQEIPGCATCVNFGQDVLSNPLLAEAIQESFVPLAIHNNKPGRDAEILARFQEPSWNNPVVYFLGSNGVPLLPKLANRYDPLALHGKAVAALEAAGCEVPGYLKLLRDDLLVDYGLARTANIETPCFWSGETLLAQHPAVLTTEAGWIGSEEVVRITYDSARVNLAALADFSQAESFQIAEPTGFRADKAPQYYLSKSRFAHLPLSRAQRTRINLAIPYRERPERFLSPRQVGWLARTDLETLSPGSTYRGDFRTEWQRMRRNDVVAAK